MLPFRSRIEGDLALVNWTDRIGSVWIRIREPLLYIMLSLGLGSAVFLYLYGYYPLAFSNLGWVYSRQDALQHFLGWQFFRRAPWTFPLGTVESYGYPFGVSLTYTDSIPLAALLLKLINPWLQARLQYLGAWTLLCLVLQGFFGMMILREFTASRLSQVLGAALLIFSPPLLYRAFYHTSLVSQWLILFSIYLVLLGRRMRVSVAWWGLACILAVTIHPYFLPMVMALFLAAQVELYRQERKLLPIFASLLGVVFVSLTVGYSIGIFSLGGEELASPGFGSYSVNLNSLFNPLTNSQFLPALPLVSYHQGEGFNYLGLGNIFLLAVAMILMLIKRPQISVLKRNMFLILTVLVLALFSISAAVSLNENVLVTISLPPFLDSITGLFRSSGRFFWPAFYLLVLAAMAFLLRRVSFAWFFLAAFLIVQILDLQPLIEGKRFQGIESYNSPLISRFWESVPDAFQHIVILPAYKQANMYAPLAIFAANHGLSLNWGYFARARYPEIQSYGEEIVQKLAAGRPEADTLYVFCQMDLVHQIAASPSNRTAFYSTDNYILGYDQANHLAGSSTTWAKERLSLEKMDAYSLRNYLSKVTDSQIVFLVGKGQPFEGIDPETMDLLHGLGLETQFDPASRDSYLALIGKPLGGKGFEILSNQQLEYILPKDSLVNGHQLPLKAQLRSAGLDVGNYANIILDGKEYALNKPGLNLVRYDLSNGEIQAASFTHGYRVVCP
jgi:hypothetical protein